MGVRVVVAVVGWVVVVGSVGVVCGVDVVMCVVWWLLSCLVCVRSLVSSQTFALNTAPTLPTREKLLEYVGTGTPAV